jgi:hypothetical protein
MKPLGLGNVDRNILAARHREVKPSNYIAVELAFLMKLSRLHVFIPKQGSRLDLPRSEHEREREREHEYDFLYRYERVGSTLETERSINPNHRITMILPHGCLE